MLLCSRLIWIRIFSSCSSFCSLFYLTKAFRGVRHLVFFFIFQSYSQKCRPGVTLNNAPALAVILYFVRVGTVPHWICNLLEINALSTPAAGSHSPMMPTTWWISTCRWGPTGTATTDIWCACWRWDSRSASLSSVSTRCRQVSRQTGDQMGRQPGFNCVVLSRRGVDPQ